MDSEDLIMNPKSLSLSRYSTHLYGDEAVRIIEEREEMEDKKPFFLYLPFQALHAPMQVSPSPLSIYTQCAPHQVPTEYVRTLKDQKTSEERILVLGMLAAMDKAVGKVVDALKRSGDFDNTLLVFTTDNGGSVSHAASNLPLRGTKVRWKDS